MWLVVGLGNPGAKYERNRHNIGFLAVESIAGKLGAGPWVRKFGGEICEAKWPVASGQWSEEESQVTGHRSQATKLYLLKPQTFMNLSGEAVTAAARFYKIPPENIIVFYDDLDLLPGKLRVKQGGGNGGHNGLKSIDAHIGKDYWRVRIGIGHPGDKDRVTDHVLSDFTSAERKVQEKMIDAIADNIGMLLTGDSAGFMNKVALILNPPAKKVSKPEETIPSPNPSRKREGDS